MHETEGIFVGVRLRPLNSREIADGQEKIFASQNNSTVQQTYNGENQTYHYDRVFNETSTTVEVYEAAARNIVQNVLGGINGCIFAYGQTSSGKTHTMLGSGEQLGVLNMAAKDIFAHIAAHPNRDFLMRASFVEIYNENIRDLLSASSEASVAIREDPRRGVYCEAVESMVSTYEELCQLLNTGISRRAVEATAMNDTSSRSHTIFKLVIESRESNRNGYEGDGAVLVATLNLADLAGAESMKNNGAATGSKVAKEGININKSLFALTSVINKLANGEYVNYRDSKLTRLLQPSLSGNAKISIICCITAARSFFAESKITLQFASRAKLIVTHATVNEVVDDAVLVKRLKRELEELKAVTSEDSVKLIRTLEKRSSMLEEQLSIKEAALEQMKMHCETDLQANAEIRAAETEARVANEALTAKLASTEEMVASLQKQLLRAATASAATTNAAKDAVLAELQSENKTLHTEVSDLLAQLEQVQAASQEESLELRAALDNAANSLRDLQATQENTAGALAAAQAECATAQEIIDSLEAERATDAEMSKVFETQRATDQDTIASFANHFNTTLKSLQYKVHENVQMSKKLTDLEIASMEAQKMIRSLEMERTVDAENVVAELSEVKRRLEDTLAQRDQQQQRADAAVQRIDSLEAQIDALQNKPEAAKDAEAGEQVIQLRAEKAQLQEDLAELSVRLRKSQEASAQLREQWEASEPERVALKEQLAGLEAERDGLVTELETAMDQINQLTEALEEATNEAELATERASSTATAGIAMESMEPGHEDAIAALEAELEQAKTDTEIVTLEAEVQREELAQKICDLEEELTQTVQQLEATREAGAALEQEVAKLTESKRADAADLMQVHGVCKNQANQVVELHAKLESSKAQLAATSVTLTAENVESQARVSQLRSELKSAQQKLQSQIESAAQELEVAAHSSFEQISSLQEQLAAKTEELSAASADIERLSEASQAMQNEVTELTVATRAQEEQIAALESQLAQINEVNNASAEAEESLRSALSATQDELSAERENLHAAKATVALMKEELVVKEERILYLDAHKLTKELTEKIKEIKEERKKFQEDAKALKKQLYALTIKFDEERKAAREARNNGVGGWHSTDYTISDLRVQLVSAAEQLSQVRDEVHTLKSELQERNALIQEYESDRNGVVAVLERHQIDTHGLIAAEHADIVDAVSQLGEKLITAREILARREILKSEKMVALEDRLSQVTAEAEEARVQKVAAEKRLEAMKASAKTAREANGTLIVEIEALTAKVEALKTELNAAQRKVTSTSDVVSSEVQALEEENIELLKENKELRVQVSRLKASAGAGAGQSSSAAFPSQSECNSVANTPARADSLSACLSGQKRAFGTDISNTVPSSAVKTAASAADVIKPVHAAASDVSTVTAAEEGAVGNTRRTRTKVGAKAVKATAQVADEGAECRQS